MKFSVPFISFLYFSIYTNNHLYLFLFLWHFTYCNALRFSASCSLLRCTNILQFLYPFLCHSIFGLTHILAIVFCAILNMGLRNFITFFVCSGARCQELDCCVLGKLYSYLFEMSPQLSSTETIPDDLFTNNESVALFHQILPALFASSIFYIHHTHCWHGISFSLWFAFF